MESQMEKKFLSLFHDFGAKLIETTKNEAQILGSDKIDYHWITDVEFLLRMEEEMESTEYKKTPEEIFKNYKKALGCVIIKWYDLIKDEGVPYTYKGLYTAILFDTNMKIKQIKINKNQWTLSEYLFGFVHPMTYSSNIYNLHKGSTLPWRTLCIKDFLKEEIDCFNNGETDFKEVVTALADYLGSEWPLMQSINRTEIDGYRGVEQFCNHHLCFEGETLLYLDSLNGFNKFHYDEAERFEMLCNFKSALRAYLKENTVPIKYNAVTHQLVINMDAFTIQFSVFMKDSWMPKTYIYDQRLIADFIKEYFVRAFMSGEGHLYEMYSKYSQTNLINYQDIDDIVFDSPLDDDVDQSHLFLFHDASIYLHLIPERGHIPEFKNELYETIIIKPEIMKWLAFYILEKLYFNLNNKLEESNGKEKSDDESNAGVVE